MQPKKRTPGSDNFLENPLNRIEFLLQDLNKKMEFSGERMDMFNERLDRIEDRLENLELKTNTIEVTVINLKNTVASRNEFKSLDRRTRKLERVAFS